MWPFFLLALPIRKRLHIGVWFNGNKILAQTCPNVCEWHLEYCTHVSRAVTFYVGKITFAFCCNSSFITQVSNLDFMMSQTFWPGNPTISVWRKTDYTWSSSRILCWTHLAQILSNESYIKNCHGTFESTLKSPPMLYFIGVTSCCCTFSIGISIEVVIEFKNLQLFFSGVIHIIHGSPLQWNFLISHIINCYPSSHIVIWSLPPERRRIKGKF